MPQDTMSPSGTLMLAEALAAPDRVAAQLAAPAAVSALAAALRAHPPRAVVTVARGSSGHAAAYGRALFETRLGLITSAASASFVTCYGARPQYGDALVLGLSQSGESPDLLAVTQAARVSGAQTAALVNVEDSPLAQAVEYVVPLMAGEERSVAATKSFITSLSALASLTAAWTADDDLARHLAGLPDYLRRAVAADWSAAVPVLAPADRMFVVARGRSLPIAQEMALKLKETSGLLAESYSAAELRHGPLAVIGPGFPVLLVATSDETLPGVLELARLLGDFGAHRLIVSANPAALALAETPLPLPPPLHPALDPIVAIQAFYPFAAALAAARGRDPDHPSHLHKVTRTF